MADKRSKFAGLFDHRLDTMPAAADRNEAPAAGPLGRPRTGKRSNPEYGPVQVLVKKHTIKQVRRRLADLDNGQDVSQLVQELLEHWVARHDMP